MLNDPLKGAIHEVKLIIESGQATDEDALELAHDYYLLLNKVMRWVSEHSRPMTASELREELGL